MPTHLINLQQSLRKSCSECLPQGLENPLHNLHVSTLLIGQRDISPALSAYSGHHPPPWELYHFHNLPRMQMDGEEKGLSSDPGHQDPTRNFRHKQLYLV
jgi:hypothetical protein